MNPPLRFAAAANPSWRTDGESPPTADSLAQKSDEIPASSFGAPVARLLIGDADKVIRRLATFHFEFDFGFTSPPYNIGYGNNKSGSGSALGDFRYAEDDDCRDEGEYQIWQSDILESVHGIMRETGSFFYNHKVRTKVNRKNDDSGSIGKEIKTFVHPLDWLRTTPFNIKQELIWNQLSTHQQNTAMFSPIDERIYWLTKDSPKIPKITIPTVIEMSKAGRKDHPAPFPPELVERVLRPFVEDNRDMVVFDPFVGSGTTSLVASTLGLSSVGIDQSERYIQGAAERISQLCPNTRVIVEDWR